MNSEKVMGTEKEFLDTFQELCYSRSSWQVWADQIFEGMLKACDGDYEIFEEEISKLLKDEKFSAISGGRVIYGKV